MFQVVLEEKAASSPVGHGHGHVPATHKTEGIEILFFFF